MENLFLGTGQKHFFINREEKKELSKVAAIPDRAAEPRAPWWDGRAALSPWDCSVTLHRGWHGWSSAQQGLRASGSTRSSRVKTGNPPSFLHTRHSVSRVWVLCCLTRLSSPRRVSEVTPAVTPRVTLRPLIPPPTCTELGLSLLWGCHCCVRGGWIRPLTLLHRQGSSGHGEGVVWGCWSGRGGPEGRKKPLRLLQNPHGQRKLLFTKPNIKMCYFSNEKPVSPLSGSGAR